MQNRDSVIQVGAWLVVCCLFVWLAYVHNRVEQKIVVLQATLDRLRLNEDDTGGSDASDVTYNQDEIHSLIQAQEMAKGLGDEPTAQQLAEALATLDAWFVKPDEAQSLQTLKSDLLVRLRKQTKDEVLSLQKAALAAPKGSEGVKKHAQAGRTLLLFPMDDDSTVIEEAKGLAAQQAEIAVRLEGLRRQRYNKWATERIEAAMNGYNENKSFLSPKKENPRLIDSLVKELGQVDPMLLEPVVLELYSYIVDVTKSSISEADKIDMAKRLTNPATHRKALGDF